MTHPRTKTIVAESKELLRKGLVALLKTKKDLEIIEASNGREVLEHLKTTEAQIVLLEANLPVLDGNAVLNIIQTRFPIIRVIILSEISNAQLQSDFMAMGASGFLCKTCSTETLFSAIEKVRTEGFFFDSITSKALLHTVIKGKQRSNTPNEISFNQRETDIIKKICDGLTNKEIAINLHLSASTIDFYRTKIYGKTKANCATGLLKYALKNGLVELT